jgi:2-amino-4-hydroxy-6-hydroxymethyldihydropteridine diphosphokinase
MKTIYLLTGSNEGDRLAQLQAAAKLVAERLGKVVRASTVYESEPWGLQGQADFLNQALEVRTALSPLKTLEAILSIEQEFGRVRSQKWAARNIDIDLLLYDDLVLDDARLRVPHPLLHERNFALVPLMEIAGEVMHPSLEKTIEELYMESQDPLEVWLFEA